VQEVATDGPVPWTVKNNLTFIAEQVSHHPPSIKLNFVVFICYIYYVTINNFGILCLTVLLCNCVT